MRAFSFGLVALALVVSAGLSLADDDRTAGGAPQPVPAAYVDLYRFLESSIADAESTFAPEPRARFRGTGGAELLTANCNRGPALLDPRTLTGSIAEMDALAKLGVRGVTICIAYPMIMPGFRNADRYLAFFAKIAKAAHERKMAVMVETGVIFSNTPFSPMHVDYSDLTTASFAKAKLLMSQRIVDEVRPDYLNLGSEPDTFARLTGLRELADPKANAELVAHVLARLDRRGVKVGAGVGSWLPIRYAQAIADTDVDFIDVHIYPLTPQMNRNAVETARLAHARGKAFTISEAWLYKTAHREVTENVASNAAVFRRDAFDFWEPLDKRFLDALVGLAAAQEAEYVSPFWDIFFFGYVPYSAAVEHMSYPDIVRERNKIAYTGILTGGSSGTGRHYGALISARGQKP